MRFTATRVRSAGIIAVSAILLSPAEAFTQVARRAPPVAERRAHVDTLHGIVRTDPYFWLRVKNDPAVAAYLDAENVYAEQLLAPNVQNRVKPFLLRHCPTAMILNCVFALLVSAQDTTAYPSFTEATFGRADSIAAAEFARDSLGSFSVGIVAGPNLVWVKSYGYADRARTRRATPTTVYRVASITKQFTALMLLQLAEQSRLRLTDRVDLYFPEIRNVRTSVAGAASPTLVQLATMTSGLARDPDDKRRSQSGMPARWRGALTRALPATSYLRPPGAGYGYSNVGYSILGAALSNAAREDYMAYQHKHILVPLGMTSSTFELTSALSARLAVGVDYDELYRDTLNYEDAARDHRDGLGWGVPSGGLYSTVGDIAKFVSFAIGFGPPGVLNAETLKMRDNIPVASSPKLSYGYGLGYQVMRWADTVAVGHSGNLAGYTSMVLYDADRKFGVVVLRSAAGGEADAGRLAGRVFRKLLASIPPAKKE